MSWQLVLNNLVKKIESEPPISPKNTAFNKNFGTMAGTVAQGNHSHSQLHNQNTDNVILTTNYAFVYPLGANLLQNTLIDTNTPITIQFTADKDAVFDTIACLYSDAAQFSYLKIYEDDVIVYNSEELNIKSNIVFDEYFSFQGIELNQPIQITNGKSYKIEVSSKVNDIVIGSVVGGYFVSGKKYLQAPSTSITYSFNGEQTTISEYSLQFALINANLAKISTENGKIETQGSSFSFNGNSILTTKDVNFSLYEPKINKNTAFNKNFGTVAGTVAEGNHSHYQYATTNLSNVSDALVLNKMQNSEPGLTDTITFVDDDRFGHKIVISKGRIISWEMQPV